LGSSYFEHQVDSSRISVQLTGAWHKTRGAGAPRHQHFQPVGRVAQQQHGGGVARGRSWAGRGMADGYGWRMHFTGRTTATLIGLCGQSVLWPTKIRIL